MTAYITKKEFIIIKLHKLLARVFYCLDCVCSWIKNFLLLFSKKARAKRLFKTGEFFEAQEEIDKAVEYFEKALDKYPGLWNIHLNLCRCYLRRLSFDKAQEHGRKFIQKDPEDAEGNLYMGVSLYYKNKVEEALVYLKKAETLFDMREKKRSSALEYIGECYMKLERYEEAIQYLEDSVAINPYGSGEKKFVSLGEAYYFLDKKEEALNAFKKALSLNPDNYEVWNNIGVLLWSAGNIEKAYQCVQKALEVKPDYVEAKANKAMMDEEIGSFNRHKNVGRRV
jgi:superkiller protein 3